MTPKIKALELFNRFYDPYLTKTDLKNAKRCALIAVDEIIKELETFYPKYESWDLKAKFSYWQEVKQEIEKL